MPRALPNFLVVGAGRSGTTGLVEGLRSHPAVFVTEPKEPHYFALHGQNVRFSGPGDEATINRVSVTDRTAYLDLYPESNVFVARGDGSVSTLYYHHRAIPEILSMNPKMRVVILLRDPVDRAYSSFQYMRARGFEPQKHFLNAVAAEETRRRAGWHHLWHYTAMSRYADAVAAFLTQLGPEQVGIWYYDDLARDYAETVNQVLRFIGVQPVEGEVLSVPRVNISGTPRSAVGQRLVWVATRNELIRQAVKNLTSFRMRERVRRLNLRPSEATTSDRAELSPQFTDDLRRLSSMLARARQPNWLSRHVEDLKGVETDDGRERPAGDI